MGIPMGISVSVDIWSARASPRQKSATETGDRSWECRRAIYQGLNCPVAASMFLPAWFCATLSDRLDGWMVGWLDGRLADWCAYGVTFNRGAGIS
ncbi:unnamed protein product [Lasius platythorax]|uniref:Uncharacterized protein n=1 Tax=Lasius platythorax TaxID=488582 RepID=A0AAV2NCW1_9HYME